VVLDLNGGVTVIDPDEEVRRTDGHAIFGLEPSRSDERRSRPHRLQSMCGSRRSRPDIDDIAMNASEMSQHASFMLEPPRTVSFSYLIKDFVVRCEAVMVQPREAETYVSAADSAVGWCRKRLFDVVHTMNYPTLM
jgi:hypothetical protein